MCSTGAQVNIFQSCKKLQQVEVNLNDYFATGISLIVLLFPFSDGHSKRRFSFLAYSWLRPDYSCSLFRTPQSVPITGTPPPLLFLSFV